AVLSALPVPQREALEAALLLADLQPAPNQLAVSLAVLGILRTLADECPVLVALDDGQWTDRPSALALEYAARRLDAEPIGPVAAVALTPNGDPPFRIDRPVSASRLTRLRVGPLPPKELASM